MNTTETQLPSPRRVRIVNDPRVVGTVFDTTEDGWILWVDDRRGCHVSHPSYVEAVS